MNTSFYGRLTRDPEVKTSANNTQYTYFTVATQMPVKNTGDNGYKSLFISCTAFGKQGQSIAQYFRKGSRIVVDGTMNDINIGHGQNGGEYLNINVNVNNFNIVDTREESGAQSQAQPQQSPQQPPQQPPQQGYTYQQQPPQQPPQTAAPPWGAPPPAPPATTYANAPY